MKLFNLVLLNNKGNKYAIIDIEKHVRAAYIKGDSEAAYAAYHIITGASIQESGRVVKPWIKKWEGKK